MDHFLEQHTLCARQHLTNKAHQHDLHEKETKNAFQSPCRPHPLLLQHKIRQDVQIRVSLSGAHQWTRTFSDILLQFEGGRVIGQLFQIITSTEIPSWRKETTKLQSVAAGKSERKRK